MIRKLILLNLLVCHHILNIGVHSEVVKVGVIISGNSSTTWPEGWTAAPTALLALEKVKEAGILPDGVDIQLEFIDSTCDRLTSRDLILESLREDQLKAYIGPPCKEGANSAVAFVAHPFFKGSIYQKPFLIATTSTTTQLDEDEVDIYRRLSPESREFRYLDIIGQHFNWRSYGLIYDSTTATIVDSTIAEYNNSLKLRYLLDHSLDVDSLARSLDIFVRNDIKIIRCVVQSISHGKVICAAYRAGLITPNHVWFLNQWVWEGLEGDILKQCTENESYEIAHNSNGFLSLSPSPKNVEGIPTDVAMTTIEFYAEMETRLLGTGFQATSWDLYVYDMVWVLAKSVHELLGDKTPEQRLVDFLESVDNVTFYGISGFVGFKGKDTISAQLRLEHLINLSSIVAIAQFSARRMKILREVQWKSGSVPLDYTPDVTVISVTQIETVNKAAALLCNIVAVLGIALCLLILVINFVYRNEKIIKITSPVVNIFILVGSIILMLCVIFLSPTALTTDTQLFLASCYCYMISFNIGFTLVFGALFVKTWRIYKAFTFKSAQQVVISDLNLSLVICGLITLDAILMIFWLGFDPLSYENLELSVSERVLGEFEIEQTHYSVLSCVATANPAIYIAGGMKGLMLLFGGFLAFETRTVKVEAANDSKSIGVCIYNFAICSVFGIIFNFALDWDPNQTYVVMAPLLLMVGMVPIGVLFGPRHLRLLIKGKPIDVTLRRPQTSSVK